MNRQIEKEDVELLFQKDKRYKISIMFMDKQWRRIGNISGYTTDLNGSFDSDSEIRRTLSMNLLITDTDIVKPGNMIWIDKYAVVQLNVYNNVTKEYCEYPMGIYVVSNYKYNFDKDQSSLQISLLDLMATFTEERGNQITTQSVIGVGITVYPCPVCGIDMTHTQITSSEIEEVDGVPTAVINTSDTYTCPNCGYVTNTRPDSTASYADISNAMAVTIKRFSKLPYIRMSLEALRKDFSDVPYDLEFDKGIYPIEIISQLRDLYPNFQTYFDFDGTFVFSKIPTTNEDEIVLDANVLDRIIISEESSADFKDVCNVHDVWGQSLSADRVAVETESDIINNITVYYCTYNDLEVLESDMTYCFTSDRTNPGKANIWFKNNEGALTEHSIPIYVRSGTDERRISAGEILENTPYVVKVVTYRDDNNQVKRKCILLGDLQIRGIVKTVSVPPDTSQVEQDKQFFACDNIYYYIEPSNPFSADIIGDCVKACSGGEFDNIYSTQLAFERGRYENYKTTHLTHRTTITTLIVPWLDVNQKIRFTSPITGEIKQYMIKSIDISFKEGTMTLSLIEFYPFYSFDA